MWMNLKGPSQHLDFVQNTGTELPAGSLHSLKEYSILFGTANCRTPMANFLQYCSFATCSMAISIILARSSCDGALMIRAGLGMPLKLLLRDKDFLVPLCSYRQKQLVVGTILHLFDDRIQLEFVGKPIVAGHRFLRLLQFLPKSLLKFIQV